MSLCSKGWKVGRVTKEGWRISEETVESAVQELTLEAGENDVILLQCLDNSTFYVMNDVTGEMTLPARGEGGFFHEKGRLTVAKDVQLEGLLGKMEPLLGWRKEGLTILVAPIPRFLEPCCDGHRKSEKEVEEEGKRILRELGTFRRAVRSMLIAKKMANVVLVDPMEIIGASMDIEKARAALADNVHLTDAGYDKVAEKIGELISTWQAGRKRKDGGAAGGSDAKRMKLQSGSGRGGWKGSGRAGRAVGYGARGGPNGGKNYS